MILLLSVWPFVIPVCVAFYMLWLCWTRGGDPGRDSTIVQYEPPEKFSPAECGALLENALTPRGISATIVDLSVRGYLTIEKNGGDTLPGPKHRQDYIFRLTTPQIDCADILCGAWTCGWRPAGYSGNGGDSERHPVVYLDIERSADWINCFGIRLVYDCEDTIGSTSAG